MRGENVKNDVSSLLKLLKEPYLKYRVPIGGFSSGYMDMEIHGNFVLLNGDILLFDDMEEDEIKSFYHRLAIIMNLKLKLIGIKFTLSDKLL